MITWEEIENIALLSKLFVAESEIESIRTDMEQMMQFAQCVADADTGDISVYDTPEISLLREDKVGDSLAAEDVLSNAQETCNGYFVVKKNG